MIMPGKICKIAGIGLVSIVSLPFILGGCSDEPETDPEMPMESPEAMPEQDMDFEDMEQMPQEFTPEEAEPVDITDPEREPDTVLATVGDEQILLQDLYDRFDQMQPREQQHFQYQLPQLLDSLVQTEVLTQKAAESGVEDTEEFSEIYQSIKAMPDAEQLDDQTIRQYAMIETLLKQEVIDQVEVSEDELQELYEQYKPMFGEDVSFEQVRPMLEQEAIMPYIEQYLAELEDEADVELDEEWRDEKMQEAPTAPQAR